MDAACDCGRVGARGGGGHPAGPLRCRLGCGAAGVGGRRERGTAAARLFSGDRGGGRGGGRRPHTGVGAEQARTAGRAGSGAAGGLHVGPRARAAETASRHIRPRSSPVCRGPHRRVDTAALRRRLWSASRDAAAGGRRRGAGCSRRPGANSAVPGGSVWAGGVVARVGAERRARRRDGRQWPGCGERAHRRWCGCQGRGNAAWTGESGGTGDRSGRGVPGIAVPRGGQGQCRAGEERAADRGGGGAGSGGRRSCWGSQSGRQSGLTCGRGGVGAGGNRCRSGKVNRCCGCLCW
mmetsp:Transcript_15253/g.48687  ORF Transcript_15253/g.48687 Transcript_15253/m.48687 type:complete len:294 (-) Transcript_15253:767-1648(-)